MYRFLVSTETVVLRRSHSETVAIGKMRRNNSKNFSCDVSASRIIVRIDDSDGLRVSRSISYTTSGPRARGNRLSESNSPSPVSSPHTSLLGLHDFMSGFGTMQPSHFLLVGIGRAIAARTSRRVKRSYGLSSSTRASRRGNGQRTRLVMRTYGTVVVRARSSTCLSTVGWGRGIGADGATYSYSPGTRTNQTSSAKGGPWTVRWRSVIPTGSPSCKGRGCKSLAFLGPHLMGPFLGGSAGRRSRSTRARTTNGHCASGHGTLVALSRAFCDGPVRVTLRSHFGDSGTSNGAISAVSKTQYMHFMGPSYSYSSCYDPSLVIGASSTSGHDHRTSPGTMRFGHSHGANDCASG